MLPVIAQANHRSRTKRLGSKQISKWETLDVVGTSIQYDHRWDDHDFNVSKDAAKCLGFLKRYKKYFTPSDLRTMLLILHQKWNTIHTYEQMRLKAHLISWIVYKVES